MRAPSVHRLSVLLVALAALAVPSGAQRESNFMKEFRKLIPLNLQEEMDALMRRHENEAILAVVETCTEISAGSSDVLETEIDALKKSWKRVYNTRFVDLQYDYFSLELQGVHKKYRLEQIKHYTAKFAEFTLAEKNKDVNAMLGLGPEFKAFGVTFSDLGDWFMAGRCYVDFARCFEEPLVGSKADLRTACEGWKLFIETRDKIELRDKTYVEAKAWIEKLEFEGFGDPGKGPEGRGEGKVVESDEVRPAIPLNAQFELVPDIEAIQRPMYTADSAFQLWPAVGLRAVDSKATINSMEPSPSFLRTGASKAAIDLDGDGKGDIDIPLTGKVTPVQLTLGEGGAKRPWAILTVIGQERDTYQTINPWNLAPSQEVMDLFIAAAGSLVGTLNGVRVQVIDDNLDGLYGSEPKDWANIGVIEGSFQHDVDSVVVGESKVARPWSRYQKVGETWYEFGTNENGTDIVATEATLRTGTLQLVYKGGLPVTWLLVRGTGDDKNLFYDVANGGTNKVEVPAGSYELYCGQIVSGKKSQMMKALILPKAQARSWKVAPGETATIELGEPFAFEFSVVQDETTVTVDGNSVVVVGRGAETYQRLWNCRVAPEVNLRKAGTSKGKKEGKLTLLGSQEQLADYENDHRKAWFPIGEPIGKASSGEDYEVQLFEKKHKLFGKIESSWVAH